MDELLCCYHMIFCLIIYWKAEYV